MKKLISIILVFFFIISGCVIAELPSSDSAKSSPSERNQYQREDLQTLYAVMSTPIPVQLPDENQDYSHLSIVDTPAEFSWKDYQGIDLTTSAKNQGQCGSCWAFGALGAIESLINIKEGKKEIDIDLSEQYLLSCVPAAGSCNGGQTASPFSFIMNTAEEGNFENGVIFEECLSYEANDDIPCSQKSDNWEETLVPITGWGEVWFGQNDPNAIDMMKSKIYEHGPIYALMYVDDAFRYFGALFHRSTDYFRFIEYNELILNHAILIVGWKDDPDIRQGGYWICKNSWGTTWGYDGFFNIVYGSLNTNYYMAWPEYDPASFDCPPIARAGGFYEGTVNQQVIFDGSGSFDDDDETLTYTWDFGDGTIGDGIAPTHVYSTAGTYNIKLIVTDDNDHSVIDTSIVFIDEESISLEFSGDNGITIEIKNHLDFDILDTFVSVDISGTFLNMDQRNEHIECITSQSSEMLNLPLIGLGKGTFQLHYENIEITREFISIGPFIFVR